MSQFFTRRGDNGYTGVLGEGRLPKDDPRLDAVGEIDEANAALGLARAVCQAETSRAMILAVQRDLYNLMAEVAATPENAVRFRTIDETRVAWLETQIDKINESVAIPGEFIVPGDSLPGAALDLARTIVRRAERRVVHLVHRKQLENEALLRYLNRLSSLCFVLELLENQLTGKSSPTLAKTE